MVDSDLTIRAFLIGTPLVQETGSPDRIVASDRLPTDYKPADGSLLLFARRGGPLDYSSQILFASYGFRSYGETEAKAKALSNKLYDVLNDVQRGHIKMARLEVPSQPIREPGTDWPIELSFYRIAVALH